MIEISRILCPVDFSVFSRRALDYAIGMARWYGARVTAVHVYQAVVPVAPFAIGVNGMAEAGAAGEEDRLAMKLRAFVDAERTGGASVDVAVVEGTTWSEIVGQSRTLESDLVVMGTHGRSGFQRVLLGSVTEKILRVAPCPVLTVPASAPEAAPIAPGLFKHILCPTDFSPAAERALAWAIALAREADAELAVLHVFEQNVAAWEADFPRTARDEFRIAYEEWCASRLPSAVPAAAREGCTVRELTASGTAHREILRVGSEEACDLIVMGVSGHRDARDRIFGSTTQHVVRGAVCPVLTVRAAASAAPC